MIGIHKLNKRFGSLQVLQDFELSFQSHTSYALMGPNGSGKTTLIKSMLGLVIPDSGSIVFAGQPIAGQWAYRSQIGYMPQIGCYPDNIKIGQLLDMMKNLRAGSREGLDEELVYAFGLDRLLHKEMHSLSGGTRQKVSAALAFMFRPVVYILDEPTAVLTPQETDELLRNMKKLRDQGAAIVFITHKLREVKEAADKITIIRRGAVVGTAAPTASQEELASLMVGRPVALDVTKAPPKLGDVLLTVNNLNIHDHTGRNLVKDISFELRAGEVLAVAGVQGNGQSELAEAIVGLQEHVTGEINLDGVDLSRSSVRQALHAGIAFVPESREEDGLISSFSIEENLILDLHDLPPFARGLVISQDEVVSNAAKRVTEFDIRAQSPKDPASSLSGGNKQKVVLARELSRPVKLVVASQPTRGLDVGSIEFVHERIIAERDSGRGVLLFSTELDEVVALADRIAVMYRGEFIAIVPTSTSREELGLLMAGIKR